MKPILYEAGTTNFNNNGIGRLSSCISCLVTEERNGVFEVEFQYPITGKYYAEIQEGRIITISHDEQGDRQPFIIYRRSAVLGGIVTFNAHHISYLLNNIILEPFDATTAAEAMLKLSSKSMNTNPFTFWTDNTTQGGTISVDVPTSVRSFLGGVRGSFLDLYGGEYEWDGYTVKNYAHRGANNGVTIRYGKNLTKLEQEVDALDLYDSVVPFWVSEDDSVIGGIVTGTGQTMSLVRAFDMSSYYEDAPTVAQLEARALSYLNSNQPWVPKQNIDIDFVALWQTEEYKDIALLERVQLCDIVTVVYTDLGVEATAKVIEVVWDALLERYNKIELGDAKSSFASTILKTTEERIAEAVSDLPTTSMMDDAIDHATDMITGGLGGYIVINRDANGYPNELLIMDTPDKTTAVNVWRWNSGGLGHSHSGYNGPYNDVAITQDGKINASMITAGTMNANLIKAGIISDVAGKNFWNMVTGEFSLQSVPTTIQTAIDQAAATAGGYTLETPFSWSNNNQTANFTAIIYKGTEDVTADFDAAQFVWTLRTEDGETTLGTGKTMTVNKSSLGYGATVTCTFTEYANQNAALLTRSNMALQTRSGSTLTMLTQSQGDVRVVDLPVKTASGINLTDNLMGVDAADGYIATLSEFASALATGVYDARYMGISNAYTKTEADARYVNATSGTMTGNLVIEKSNPYVILKATNVTVGTSPSSNTYPSVVLFRDSAGTNVGYVRSAFATDGRTGVHLEAVRSVSGSNVYNNVTMWIASNGTRTVTVSDASAWRTALGVNGTVSTVNTSSIVNVTTETNTNLINTGSLSAGTYLIHASASFTNNGTGLRRIHLSSSSAGSTADRHCVSAVGAASGSTTNPCFIYLVTISSATTYYLVAWQNSGSTLATTAGLRILKIH